jgi:hypothetical protein
MDLFAAALRKGSATHGAAGRLPGWMRWYVVYLQAK